MKKFLVNLMCAFVPSRARRGRIRKHFFPPKPAPHWCYKTVLGLRALPDPVKAWKDFTRGQQADGLVTVTRSLGVIQNGFAPAGFDDTATPKEKAEFLENSKKLAYGRLKITDDCFAFGPYLLPVDHFEYSVFCAKHGMDTIDISKIPSDSVIMDVGAFVGDSALVISKYLENKIYSFEPLEENYKLMIRTIELNDIGGQVIPVKSALAREKGAILFASHQMNSFASDNQSGGDFFGEKLPVDTMDNFASKNNLKVGLIKVDIEGGEQDFLLGARETISRDRPILLLSIYHAWADLDYFKIKYIVESWNLGYKFRIFKPWDDNLVAETLLICTP